MGEFAEVGDGLVVEERGGGSAGLEPGGGFGVNVRAEGPPGEGEEGEQGFDGALELEEGGDLRGVDRSVAGTLPVRPRESWGDSWTAEMKEPSAGIMPVKIWPCSKRRTSFTSRLRLWASIVTCRG